VEDTSHLKADDLAWGKLPGYPWYPIEIESPKSMGVGNKRNGEHFGIFFDRDYGAARSWLVFLLFLSYIHLISL
jgi:hypothetical protein